MTRAERRELRRGIAEMRNQARNHPHPYARRAAADALAMLETTELLDPRPSWRLRLHLRLRGIDAG